MVAQLVIYADEYRRGTVAVNAPNNVVRGLTGQEAEDFEAITRRAVAERPEAVQTFGNKLKAIRNFLKVPFTFGANPEAIEHRRARVAQVANLTFSRDSQAWVETHDPAAGFVPDRPGNGASIRIRLYPGFPTNEMP